MRNKNTNNNKDRQRSRSTFQIVQCVLIITIILVFLLQIHIISLDTLENVGKSLPMQDSVQILTSILKNEDYDITDTSSNQILHGDFEKLLTLAFADKKGTPKVDQALLNSLPPLSDFKSLYGEKPTIIGLDTCKAYREKIPIENRIIGPAGLFNTGTNLMAQLLDHNCMFQVAKQKKKKEV